MALGGAVLWCEKGQKSKKKERKKTLTTKKIPLSIFFVSASREKGPPPDPGETYLNMEIQWSYTFILVFEIIKLFEYLHCFMPVPEL